MLIDKYSPRRVTLRSGEVRAFDFERANAHEVVWTFNENNEAKPVTLPQRMYERGPDEWSDELSCDLRDACDGVSG